MDALDPDEEEEETEQIDDAPSVRLFRQLPACSERIHHPAPDSGSDVARCRGKFRRVRCPNAPDPGRRRPAGLRLPHRCRLRLRATGAGVAGRAVPGHRRRARVAGVRPFNLFVSGLALHAGR